MKELEQTILDLESSEVIKKIRIIMERIDSVPVDHWAADALVDHVFTLVKLMYNLGEMVEVEQAKLDLVAEEYKDAVRATYLENKDKKLSDNTARTDAEVQHKALKQKEILQSLRRGSLKRLYETCDRMVNFTQTKVKLLTNEAVRSKLERT
jgi:hypothetical protein